METMAFSPDHLVVAGVVQSVLMYSFRALFFLSAILLMVIVLLQEGKGGGLASALGGQGAETFGVATGGVNKVTLFLAGLFLLSALGHALTTGGVVSGMRKAAPPKPAGKAQPLEVPGEGGGDVPGSGEAPAPGDGTKAPPAGEEKAPPVEEKK